MYYGESPAEHLLTCVFSQIKLPIPTMPPSESLLRTDSLSSTGLSDGSVGSAPSLGLSPGPSTAMDISRNELNQIQDKIVDHQEKAGEVKNSFTKSDAILVSPLCTVSTSLPE